MASFHSWCCPSCDNYHETYGSRTDASTRARECALCDTVECVSCIATCRKCGEDVCAKHATDQGGDTWCTKCVAADEAALAAPRQRPCRCCGTPTWTVLERAVCERCSGILLEARIQLARGEEAA